MKEGLVENVARLAREAGRKIMPFYKAAMTVKTKDDRTPLTEADMASHHYLVDALKDLLPGINVLSEESALETPAELGGQFWLVDPLDGTKEFLKGTNEFTVNIGLIRDGYPVLGVVHAPALGITYLGAKNNGAWRQLRDEPRVAIRTRQSDVPNLAIVASKDHSGPLVKLLVDEFPKATFRSMGSSLKFCLVAEGSADIYLRDLPTMEWDTAAAQCVVEAAGGHLICLDGQRLRYGKAGLRNPSIITVGDKKLELPMKKLCAGS